MRREASLSCRASAAETLAPLPRTFRRLVANRVGKSFRDVAVIQEVPLVLPGPGQVLIRLEWAGINGGCETFRVRGEYAFRGNLTLEDFALGAEGSGVVVAVGDGVTKVKVGQAVAANGCAAFAEYGLTSERMVTPVDVAGPEAVALVLSALTACAALEGTAEIRNGERVLVTAACGGTGHFAVQLARLAGCDVVAVVGGPKKAALAFELGANLVIDYHSQDVGAVMAEHFPRGVDVMYEGVGGALRAALLPHLAPGGRLLQVGYISEYPHNPSSADGGRQSTSTSGRTESIETLTGAQAEQGLTTADLFWGGHDIQDGDRHIIGKIWPKDATTLAQCKSKVFDLYRQSLLRVVIDSSHSFQGLEQIPDAIEHMLKGGHSGKVVIKI